MINDREKCFNQSVEILLPQLVCVSCGFFRSKVSKRFYLTPTCISNQSIANEQTNSLQKRFSDLQFAERQISEDLVSFLRVYHQSRSFFVPVNQLQSSNIKLLNPALSCRRIRVHRKNDKKQSGGTSSSTTAPHCRAESRSERQKKFFKNTFSQQEM